MTRATPEQTFGTLDWAARPVAPSENLKLGLPVTFGRRRVVRGDGPTVTLRADLDLQYGFPTSAAYLAVDPAEGAATVNGKAVEMRGHVWEPLVAGRNTLAVTARPGSAVALAVRVQDVDAEGDAAEWVLRDEDWRVEGGSFAPGGEPTPGGELIDRPRRSVELRRVLPDPGPVRRATLTLVGPTLREVTLNGRAVTDHVLEPGWTDYRKRLTVVTHNVTDLFRGGPVDWRITLANGWYTGGMGPQQTGRFAEPDDPLWIAAELAVKHLDGTTTRHATGDGWAWRPSATRYDTLYNGEHRGPPGDDWRAVRVHDVPAGLLVTPSDAPPVRPIEELRPVAVDARGGGRFVLDFGQNHTGVCRVDLAGVPTGSRLRLRHAEVLTADGEPNVVYLRTARATDRIETAGEAGWTPRFTYHGYRYAEISGLPDGLTADDVRRRIVSVVLHGDAASAGDFDCSDPLLNQILAATRWGIRSNLHSIITDCPQRDERLGWTGDVQMIAETAPWFLDLRRQYRKCLLDLIDAQRPDGGLPHVAPQTVVDDVSMGWADVIAALPWAMWRHYGDRGALEIAYPALRRWMDYLDEHEEGGRLNVGSFGDWVPVVGTPEQVVVQAWGSWSARLAGGIARVLGHGDDAARFDAAADRRGAWFHREFFDPAAGCYTPDTQTAQVLPLAFGIVPPEHVAGVRAALAANVRRHGGRLTVGFCGAPHLLHALSDAGHDDLALGVIDTDEKPSLGYMIRAGATTLWERWDSDTAGPDMNSRNHFAFGSMTRWLFEHLAGVTLDRADDGRLTVALRPRPIGDLTHAEVRRELPEGLVRLRWERDGGRFTVTGDAPAGADTRLVMPGGAAGNVVTGGFRAVGSVEGGE